MPEVLIIKDYNGRKCFKTCIKTDNSQLLRVLKIILEMLEF